MAECTSYILMVSFKAQKRSEIDSLKRNHRKVKALESRLSPELDEWRIPFCSFVDCVECEVGDSLSLTAAHLPLQHSLQSASQASYTLDSLGLSQSASVRYSYLCNYFTAPLFTGAIRSPPWPINSAAHQAGITPGFVSSLHNTQWRR